MTTPATTDEDRIESAIAAAQEARALLAQGKVAAALELCAQAEVEITVVAGEDAPDLGFVLWIQGSAHALAGALPEAEACFARALRCLDDCADDPLLGDLVARIELEHVDICVKRGRLLEAEARLRELLARAGADQASLYNVLGMCLRFQARYDEAELAYQRAIDRLAAEGQPPSAVIEHNLAGLATARGDFAAAERRLRLAVTRHAAEKKYRFLWAADLSGLGDALAGQGRFREAEAAYREALAMHATHAHRDHPEVAFALNNLADVLTELGRTDEAEAAYRESLRRKERALGADHYELAPTLNNLAVLLIEAGRSGEARPLATRAVEIAGRSLPPEHPLRRGCEAVAASLGG